MPSPDEELQSRIFNAFNPLDPASPEQYLSTDAARGTEISLVSEFLRHVKLSRDRHIRFLFSGHIGSGKSSELRHLQHRLLTSTDQPRFFPVLIDSNEYLSDYDADAIDLLLVIVAEIAAAFREE